MIWGARLSAWMFLAVFLTSGCAGLKTQDKSPALVWLNPGDVSQPTIFEPRNAVDLTNFIRSDRVYYGQWFPLIDETNARAILQHCPDGVIVIGSDGKSARFMDSGFVLRDYECAETNRNQADALREVPLDRFRDDWLLSPETYSEHADLSAGPQDRVDVIDPTQPRLSLVDPWFHAVMFRRCGSMDYRTRDHVWTERGWIAAQIKCEPPIMASAAHKRDHMSRRFLRDPNVVCQRQPGVRCDITRRQQ